MEQSILPAIVKGLIVEVQQALRSCKGFKVKRRFSAQSGDMTFDVLDPYGDTVQLVEVTGEQVRATWTQAMCCPVSLVATMQLERVYEYADPGFTLSLRKDSREAARMWMFKHPLRFAAGRAAADRSQSDLAGVAQR
jgi:hypothetical protein